MTDPSPPEEREPHSDPEVEALLHFEPVVRKCVRHDGWLAERQREFIIALTELGHAEQAAHAVGGTMSGAYKLRTANGGEGFAKSWDSALALHLRRNPRPEPKGRPSRGEIESGVGRTPWPSAAPPSGPTPDARYRHAPSDPPEMSVQEFLREISRRYLLKLRQEREARLEGRIVEADYYVRQLSWIEIVADIGGNAQELIETLKRGGVDAIRIAATPMSAYLEKLRRLYWQEKGEAARPPAPPMGEHGATFATGPDHAYCSARDGDRAAWEARQAEQRRLDAEAQQAWEEKARAESEEWAKGEAKGDGSDEEGPEAEGEAGEP